MVRQSAAEFSKERIGSEFMIKTERGNISISGSKEEVEADFHIIARALLENGVLSEEELDKVTMNAKKPIEEFKKEMDHELSELLKKIHEVFTK